jgi:amidohydrolase
MIKAEALIERCIPEAIELRRELHAHPELGYEEVETVKRVLRFLDNGRGMEVQTGVGGTGLVIVLGKDRPGPCVGIRADMDALPIEEQSGVAWASQVKGKMHACGHDGHTAMLAGAARVLLECEALLEGPVKLIFQPAEEGGAGGLAMCEAGVLENPPVAAVFGLHNNLPGPEHKVGTIAYTEGPAMAGTGIFSIVIEGKGGHAAFPHRCVDPITIGAYLVGELQSLVGRRLNPLVPGVVSVTTFAGGTTHNVIPGQVLIRGTFRALDAATLRQLAEGIRSLSEGLVKSHGGRAEVDIQMGYPVLMNDERAIATFRQILEEFGDGHRLVKVAPNMGGEDFAYFAQRVPSFFYYLPACPPEKEDCPGCHHPAFDFNDELIGLGIRLHVATALGFARHWKG